MLTLSSELLSAMAAARPLSQRPQSVPPWPWESGFQSWLFQFTLDTKQPTSEWSRPFRKGGEEAEVSGGGLKSQTHSAQ